VTRNLQLVDLKVVDSLDEPELVQSDEVLHPDPIVNCGEENPPKSHFLKLKTFVQMESEALSPYKSYSIRIGAFACENPKLEFGSTGLFPDRDDTHKHSTHTATADQNLDKFHFFIQVASGPWGDPISAYNFKEHPQDICFQIHGEKFYTPFKLDSNTNSIPQAGNG